MYTICATYNVIWPLKYVLNFDVSTLCSMCVVPSMVVSCCYLMLCSAVMLLRFCLSGFEIIPIVPVITGITSDFTFHVR